MKFVFALLAFTGLVLPLGVHAQGATPVNDECANATPVAVPTFGTTNYYAVDTRDASGSVPAPGCTSASGDDDLWYSFVAGSDGIIFRYRNAVIPAGSTGIGYAIYAGCDGEEVACNFNFGDGVTGSDIVDLLTPLIPGETYNMRVFTQGADGGGTFEFGIQAYQRNDECAEAEEIFVQIPGGCAYTNLSTQNFSRTQSPSSACALTSNNDDGWYRFQATSEYVIADYANLIATTGSATGLGYSLHDGCSGVELACSFSIGSNGSGREVLNPLSPFNLGQVYLLRLYLEGPTSSGTFDFCLQEAICSPPFVRYSVIFDECETVGAQVVATAFDLGGGDSLLIVNDLTNDTLVFKSTGSDTTAAFPLEGQATFTALNQISTACDKSETVDVYCPADNQTCDTSRDLLINDPGSCDLLNEAKNWNTGTSEYPIDPSCGTYRGGDLFYVFTAPTNTLEVTVQENPFSTLALSVNELNCLDGGTEIDCKTVNGTGRSVTLEGMTIGAQYTLRVYDRGDNDFGTAVFCVQAEANLPAELVDFSGLVRPKTNEISWITASEVGVSHFAVMRSANGTSGWETIANEPAANTSAATTYTITDNSPLATAFYRLNTVDLDGSVATSAIIQLQRDKVLTDVRVFPNPVGEELQLQFVAGSSPGVLTVLDARGREVIRQIAPVADRVTVNVATLSPGIYTIRTVIAGELVVKRFVRK
ncbi:T9SS type A sorting domain-containing protein [Lewinella sp. 4G2]|uniref:T9SS type A sorting domain-containing protein n=1 Tax=Lewinella sp. 4G2 TaxID=1803372 RepID=UPI0007B4F56D|nr:T9SS type A sorting domain-containing protein [Lewinella sp. 4G2]OAV44389.1 hypothetical protein A3850_007730 [Lewinella sp. 4G2]